MPSATNVLLFYSKLNNKSLRNYQVKYDFYSVLLANAFYQNLYQVGSIYSINSHKLGNLRQNVVLYKSRKFL